jgi:ribosomal protein S27E
VDTAPLDGNATAGALAELFVFDVTVARTTCATCGDVRPIGELHAYVRAAGTVLRCATCGAVQVRLVRAPDRAWLDLRGVRVLEVPVPGST